MTDHTHMVFSSFSPISEEGTGDPLQYSCLGNPRREEEEPGRLQFMGSLRVGHDRATSLSCIGEGNGNPLQCSCLENPRDGGAWWAAVNGVTQSRIRLKQLSSSSPIIESNQLISEQKFLFEILHDIREEKAPLFYLIIF